MNERAPRPRPTPLAPASGPIVVEDRTAPEFRARVDELRLLRKWVAAERAAGHPPN